MMRWRLLYFILRRYTGVSKQHAQLDEQHKEAERLFHKLEAHDVEDSDEDTN